MMTPTLTSRQRMATVLRGGIPDRVPFHPSYYFDHACLAAGRRFEDFLIDPLLGNRVMLQASRLYRTDTVRMMSVPDEEWFRDKVVREEDGQLVQSDRRTGKKEGIYDVAGGGKFQPFEPPQPVRTLRDVEAIPVLSAKEWIQRGRLRGLRECIDEAHRLGLFVVCFCSGQTINYLVEKLGGTEPALLAFYDEPKLVHALFDRAVEISIERAKAYVEVGADLIYIGDSYASASVISPAIYEAFCAPAYRRMAAEVRAMGAFTYKHCCGYYDPLLDQLPATGIDAMDGIDPTTGMTVRHTKEAVGDRITLIGGLSCLTLLQGTPDEVYAEARACLEQGKPGGRYVLGSACAIPRLTPAENIHAARKAVEDFGWY
jgi:uroporphyrinogen-III decarboxylase